MKSKEFFSAGDLIEYSIGGGWGKEEAQGDFKNRVAIVRGADFPDVENGVYANLPVRWEKPAKAIKAALRAGDTILEISGGTDDRPTGRTVYITQDLLDSYECPVIPASFCRLVRPKSEVDSAYLFYWLQDMYNKGRTWGYQNRSTGLSNFQFKVFSELEQVALPDCATQHAIANLLLLLEEKRRINIRTNDYLAELCEIIAGKYCKSDGIHLRDICCHIVERCDCSEADLETYISTELLLQDKRGRRTATSLPVTGKVLRYKAGDTLISNIRPYFKKIWYATFDGTCSNDVLVFRANDVSLAPYLHACLRQDYFFDHVMSGAKGTKMPRGDKEQMMEFTVSKACTDRDLSVLNVALDTIAANLSEVKRLTEIRDAMLPKLMHGEIDVDSIDI